MATWTTALDHHLGLGDRLNLALRNIQAALPFALLPIILPLLALTGLALGGAWHLLMPAVVFGLVPALDLFLGEDRRNPGEERMKELVEARLFRWITWAWVPVQVVAVAYGAWAVTHLPMSGWEQAGFALSMGIMSGAMGINVAHELCHKPNTLEQTLGKILLATVSYMHFAIEHNLGHHVNVSTPADPATSRLGESLYRFYPRTVVGSWLSAWRIEARRLERSGLPALHVRNQMIHFTLIPLAITALFGALWGVGAALFFVLQSIVAFSLLEVINYVEHYGLERREIAPGRFERVNPLHSWNSAHKLTNAFLFLLQRHSDHHANAQRRYQTLRHFDASPQLPTGYAGMILLALFPPLWRRVMDPRVLAFRARQATPEE